MKVSKSSFQILKPNLKINHLSSQKRQIDDVGPMASLLKTRSVVRFRGPDTIKFLQGLLTNDIRKFGEPAGDEKEKASLDSSVRSLYAAMLTPQGRFLYDMFLYKPPRMNENGSKEQELLADVDSSVLDELVETLNKYRLRSKVEIEKVGDEFSCWQRYGVDEASSLESSSSRGNSSVWQWHKDPRLDCLGFRGIFPSNTIPPIYTETEEQNFVMWRLDKGVAEGSIEIPKGEAIPLEYNLAGLNAISFEKGCYIGQELIARSHHRGVIRKRLIPLKFPNEEVTQKGSEVIAVKSGKKVGTVTTALGSRGLGLLRLEEAFKQDLVIKDVKVKAVRPEWWPRDWFLDHEPHQAPG